MLIDPDCSLYNLFRLGRSYFSVFCHEAIVGYAEEVLAGRSLIGAPKAIGSAAAYKPDFFLMGGDFVVDSGGRVLLSHPSKTTVDRPQIDEYLNVDRVLD
jgi:hypothetical protein